MKGLYVITDEELFKGRTHLEIALSALKGGAKIIQLRDKKSSDRYFYESAKKIKKLCEMYNAKFIINDRIHICLAVDADGVNVGQNDLPCNIVRNILGKDKIIGISCSTYEEAVLAEKEGADYIGLGPIFSTNTKTDYECITGLDLITKLKKEIKIPIAAIGGINKDNISMVKENGADMLCVVSAVVNDKNMEEATKNLIDIIK